MKNSLLFTECCIIPCLSNLKTRLLVNTTVRPTVHINPSRKRSFPKTLFKKDEFENASFAFSCGQKTF